MNNRRSPPSPLSLSLVWVDAQQVPDEVQQPRVCVWDAVPHARPLGHQHLVLLRGRCCTAGCSTAAVARAAPATTPAASAAAAGAGGAGNRRALVQLPALCVEAVRVAALAHLGTGDRRTGLKAQSKETPIKQYTCTQIDPRCAPSSVGWAPGCPPCGPAGSPPSRSAGEEEERKSESRQRWASSIVLQREEDRKSGAGMGAG